MAAETTNRTRRFIKAWTGFVLVFLYVPILTVVVVSFVEKRYFSWPTSRFTTEWYADLLSSITVHNLFWTSLTVAALVTLFSVILGVFGALAFARYDWQGRKLFQKLILLPIFFPQAVLGLSLLLWFSALGITTSWQTAVFAHMVWIVPIVTLIMAIQVYGFDPALEEAAFDLGAGRFTVFKEVTLPILAPGIITGGVFAFLLSWGNFALSLFSTGADQTIPEWLYSKMTSGYNPTVPALGTLTMAGAVVLALVLYALFLVFRKRQRRAAQVIEDT